MICKHGCNFLFIGITDYYIYCIVRYNLYLVDIYIYILIHVLNAIATYFTLLMYVLVSTDDFYVKIKPLDK